jgi:hypothetical protein
MYFLLVFLCIDELHIANSSVNVASQMERFFLVFFVTGLAKITLRRSCWANWQPSMI